MLLVQLEPDETTSCRAEGGETQKVSVSYHSGQEGRDVLLVCGVP